MRLWCRSQWHRPSWSGTLGSAGQYDRRYARVPDHDAFRRHAIANVRAIRSFDVHVKLEPTRLLRGYDKRPVEATLDPWHSGKYFCRILPAVIR